MEGSSSKKPLTAYEMEDKCGSKKPNFLPSSSSSSSSSSKPPLGPVPLLQIKPNNNSNPSLLPAIEAVTGNNSQQDKNEQLQTPNDSSGQNNNNVTLNDASSEQYHHETKNQHEPTTKVSDPSEEARRLRRVMSNRMSANRSRLRKLQHVANLERQCAQLKNQITFLQPQVEAYTNLKHKLMLEQTVLTQRFSALENETLLKQAEIERNQAEVYELRELEKQQREAEAQAMMMAFAHWDTLPNNQQILVNTDIPAQGFHNMEGMSEMEVDEQTMNLDSLASMNELDAIVNPPKLSDNSVASSEFRSYF